MTRQRSLQATSRSFEWTDQKREAAALIAESNLPLIAVAADLGVRRETLWKWRQIPAFAAAVAEIEAELDRDATRFAIVRRRERLAGYDERRDKALAVIEQRAEHYADRYPDVPGGDTGLLTPTFKVVGSGPTAHTIVEHVFDAALAREVRDLERQAAQDAGQWSDKSSVETLAVVQQVTVTERQILRLPPRDRSKLTGEPPIDADFTELTDLDRGKAKALRDRATAEARPATPTTKLEQLLERLAREDGLRPTPQEHLEARAEDPALYDTWYQRYRLINDVTERPVTDR